MSENSRDTIKKLTMREQARTQIDVWFQSRDNYLHPIREIGINGSDEINNNFDSGEVIFKLHDDNKTMTIIDTGRGMPINGKAEDGTPNYELLLLTLFAGTNYNNNENGKITTGQHGLGATVSNYCSTYFNVKSYQKTKMYEIEFKDGGEISKPLTENKIEDGRHGTEITFTLDDEIFTNTVYNPEEVALIVKHMASVNPKITFKFIYNNKETVYHYDTIEEYFDEIATMNTCQKIIGEQKKYTIENELNYIELVMTTSSEPVQESYLNITHLIEGGTIEDGIIDGVRTFLNAYCKEKKLFKKNDNKFSNDDIKDSISFVCSVGSTSAIYSGQAKFSTKKELYKKIAKDYTHGLLEIFKAEKSSEFDKFVKHVLEVKTYNTRADESKKNLKRKLTEKVDGVGNRVEGAVECIEHGKNSELYICEGKSALGTCVTARNARFQACIAVRGKILSTLKVGYDRIFKSEIIMDIIKMLGCGVQLQDKNKKNSDTFNIDNLRFHKIVLTADSDADGATICCLLLTMFWRLTPYLIENGYIYIAKTPLYEITFEDGTLKYAFNDKEKETLLKGHNLSKCIVKRDKGLGELDPEVMAYTTMNPETRTIERVTVEDAERMSKQFYKWFGDDVSERREHIVENLHKYVTDID